MAVHTLLIKPSIMMAQYRLRRDTRSAEVHSASKESMCIGENRSADSDWEVGKSISPATQIQIRPRSLYPGGIHALLIRSCNTYCISLPAPQTADGIQPRRRSRQ